MLATGAAASLSTQIQKGNTMQKRTIALSVVIVLTGALGAPTAASAAQVEPVPQSAASEGNGVHIPSGAHAPRYTVTPEGGGSWTYGTNGPNNTAYSNFYHASRKHGSSVQNGRGNVARSATVAGGATAKSSITKTYAGNIAYYRFVN